MVCLVSYDQLEGTEKKKKKAQVTAMLRKCDRRRPAQNKVERKSTQFHQRGRWHGCVLDFPLFA